MDQKQFVDALAETVRGLVPGELESLRNPPGRRPWASSVRQSEWLKALPAEQDELVAQVMELAAYAALHQVLCVLDGVSAIEGAGPKGTIEVQYRSPDGAVTNLRPEEGVELHDLLKDVWFPYS